MIFNSYIFILAFFPASVIGYQLVRRKRSSLWNGLYISLVSLIFYCYSEVFHGFVFIGILLCNLICYFLLEYIRQVNLRKLLLILGIIGNISWLIYYKYYNFAVDNLNVFFHMNLPPKDSELPLGISFISFHMIAFLIDAYRNEIKNFTVGKYFAYFTFYPKVVSGPIVTYNEMQKSEENRDYWELLAEGLYLFVMGLFKKVFLADQLGSAVDWAYGNLSELNSVTMILVSFMYSLQIYFDFSGYSDMAIGVARTFGYVLPVNFNSPYKAMDIADFWDRWHMTLTKFFTQYLYIPLGGSRKGKVRTYGNIIIVFLCSGLWHGASWTFVVWGACHGVLMILHRIIGRRLKWIPHAVKVLMTFLVVNFTWIIFRAGSIEQLEAGMEALIRWDGIKVNAEVIHCFDNILFGVAQSEGCIIALVCILLTVALLAAFFLPNTQGIVAQRGYLNWKMTIVIIIAALVSILSLSDVTNYIYAMF